jgi:hypothetical protein
LASEDYDKKGANLHRSISAPPRRAAFADTCKALGLDADHELMPLVAQHVMGLGQRGVKNRAVIYLLTLEEFRSYQQ